MPKAARRPKDKRDSHLYTDDNPTTTLHGTGFKDAEAAHRTIKLVAKRSLTYQFQTINTMLHRAKHHPHKTSAMTQAISILEDWTKDYKARKEALLTFKLLPKTVVDKYLALAESYNEDQCNLDSADLINTEFATMYISLGPKKRLANTLVDPKKPEEDDWEVRRYRVLCELTRSQEYKHTSGDLWQKDKNPTVEHLRLLMWAYSPAAKGL